MNPRARERRHRHGPKLAAPVAKDADLTHAGLTEHVDPLRKEHARGNEAERSRP